MTERLPLASSELFYDPFAESAAEQTFDPIASHQSLWQRYQAGVVEHDYAADQFVADSQVLMLDSQFIGKFEAATMIAQRMHELCGGDEHLDQAARSSELFGYGQASDAHHADHSHDKDKKEAKKTKTKKKSVTADSGWLSSGFSFFKPKQKPQKRTSVTKR